MEKRVKEKIEVPELGTSKDGQVQKIPMRLVNSRSTAVLLFNRNGFEEKEHLSGMYKHRFFNENNEIERNTERDVHRLIQ